MSRRKKRRLIAEINVVPYIDVTLVLLVVFMVTAPLLMQGVDVDLPRAPSEPIDESRIEPLIVSIKSDGSLYLNVGSDPETAIAATALESRVGRVLRAQPETPVLIWGDQAIAYGEIVALMTRLQAAGADSVGLVTEPI